MNILDRIRERLCDPNAEFSKQDVEDLIHECENWKTKYNRLKEATLRSTDIGLVANDQIRQHNRR